MLHLILPIVLTLAPAERAELPLDGTWEITTADPADAAARWLPVTVPASFETALGNDFDGVATYRRTFDLPADFGGERLVLDFDGVATEAHVWLNDELVGVHLGAWTAFRADVTAVARRGALNRLLVMVDEKVGHNTQGFLPILCPHFGGIWQSVRLLGLPDPWINDLQLLAVGDPEAGTVLVEAPLVGAAKGRLEAEVEIAGKTFTATLGPARREIHVEGFEPWDLDRPNLYPIRFRLLDERGNMLDAVETRVAFRSIETAGKSLLLNGRPLNVRGMLEWGYFPPLLAPAPPDELVRQEIAACRARGFNLVKFCLWLPPKRILRLFDAAGMLAWVEYPTWHPRFDAEHQDELVREFEEFYAHDRNHPAVLLRSLTCETGPSAAIEVIQDLYLRAHARTPGAVVVDDSSWIQWNRVFDFYDDHPYGNNDDWPEKLDALNRYIEERVEKPLLLGEAIAADTWLDRASARAARGQWWAPIHLDAVGDYERRVAERFGVDVVNRLEPWSLRFAMNQRKDQVETFRLLVPEGGYVISVARDTTLVEMGLANHLYGWKWGPKDWTWHGDTMVVLGRSTPRSLTASDRLELPVFVAHHGELPLEAGPLSWTFGDAAGTIDFPGAAPGTVVAAENVCLEAPAVEQPTEVVLHVELPDWRIGNRWSFWVVPAPAAPKDDGVTVAAALDPELFARLEAGARVLLLADGTAGSFVVRPLWFLRGSVWLPLSPLSAEVPPELFLDLTVKDLHPAGLLPVSGIFDQIDPIVAFWETHDLEEVHDWALVFETRVGEGRLLVSALNHDNAAGAYLTGRFREHLATGPVPATALAPDMVEAIANRLAARTLDLTGRTWKFRPDPPAGEPDGAPEWVDIKVGRSWEGLGFPALDGWATYRLELEFPPEWLGEPVYLNFEGVDDAFEVTFAGARVGSGGDIENRVTAFDQKSSHPLTAAAEPGPHTLEVRVYDWYGAGGIHRPVSLSTRPLGPAAEFIQGR